MALATYTDLLATAGEWLNRADLTAQIPDFVTLAEAQFNRRLRTRAQLAIVPLVVDAARVALPADYSGIKTLSIDVARPQSLEYVTPDEMVRIRAERADAQGLPRWFTIVGSQIEFAPRPDQTYNATLLYFQKLPRLSTAVGGVNWLLAAHPDLYLYATLAAASAFLQDDERVPMWAAATDAIYESIEASDSAEVQTGQPLKMRVKPFGKRY